MPLFILSILKVKYPVTAPVSAQLPAVAVVLPVRPAGPAWPPAVAVQPAVAAAWQLWLPDLQLRSY